MNSFISWIGGKKLLRSRILQEFPEPGTFDRYIEVFGGAAWLLFARDKHAKMEVYNDVNGQLVNLFRVVKYHPEALQAELDWILMSREQFFDAIQEVRGLTDIQRARRLSSAQQSRRMLSRIPPNRKEAEKDGGRWKTDSPAQCRVASGKDCG